MYFHIKPWQDKQNGPESQLLFSGTPSRVRLLLTLDLFQEQISVRKSFNIPCRSLCCTSLSKQSEFSDHYDSNASFFFSSCLSPPPPPPRLFMIHRAFVKDSNINVGLRCHQVPPGYLLLLLLFCSLCLKYYFLISTDKWPSSDWLKSLNSSMHWGCSKVLRFGNFFYWT